MKKSAPLVTQCEWKMVETLENNTEVPQKIKKKKIPYDSAVIQDLKCITHTLQPQLET